MNSNLVFVLLLLFAAALIVFAVLPPLRRWQRDREWEEFGTDLDIGGAIAGRIDGGDRAPAPGNHHLAARADPTGGQDGERTHTDIALEELRRLERLNLAHDDEFDAFEEYLSGRRQERSRHGAPSQPGSSATQMRAGAEPREIVGGPGRDGRPADEYPAEHTVMPRQWGNGPARRDPRDPERVADDITTVHAGRPVDGRPADDPRETTGELDLPNGRPPSRNGLVTTSGPGTAGIDPTDTAADLVRAAGGQGADGEPYDWKAAAQYERARSARAGRPAADAPSAPPDPPSSPRSAAAADGQRWHVIRSDETEPTPVHVVEPQARQHGDAGVRVVGPAQGDGAPVPDGALADDHTPSDRDQQQPEHAEAEPELQTQATYAATPPGAQLSAATAPPAPGLPQDGPAPAPAATEESFPPPPAQPVPASPLPGAAAAPAPDLPPVLSEDEINDLRTRWIEVKASFPDDPIAAVREAKQLVNECTDLLAERLEVRRDQGEVSTEDLRLALRRYVAFYERLLWA